MTEKANMRMEADVVLLFSLHCGRRLPRIVAGIKSRNGLRTGFTSRGYFIDSVVVLWGKSGEKLSAVNCSLIRRYSESLSLSLSLSTCLVQCIMYYMWYELSKRKKARQERRIFMKLKKKRNKKEPVRSGDY